MNKVKFHHWPNPFILDIDTEKNVDVYIDQMPISPIPDNTIRIIQVQEPLLEDALFNEIHTYRDYYNYVLAYHEKILVGNHKARFFLRTLSWMKGHIPQQKNFSVSTVVGGKSEPRMEGYALRHDLWRNKDLITMPKEFYLSGKGDSGHIFTPWDEVDYSNQLVLGLTKEPLFDSMFHIAIENTSIKNMFSEKLLDCFQTRTVPIYYGCTNIGDYFNTAGIIIVNSINEIIDVCNRLTLDTYFDMLPAMEDNFKRSEAWTDDMQQFKDAIINLIK